MHQTSPFTGSADEASQGSPRRGKVATLIQKGFALARVLATDRKLQIQFFTYAGIGLTVQIIDVSLFQFFVWKKTIVEVAVSIAGSVALLVHFSLNKYVNFRNHDRTVARQFGTYLAVGVVWWIITISIVSTLTRWFGIVPLYAKFAAVAVNFPLGFVAHRYLTFGQGIQGTIRAWLARRSQNEP
jgi:putative flippase GtrA